MSKLNYRDFQTDGQRSRNLQAIIREKTFAPETTKTLRTFSSWEVAELILKVHKKTLQKKLIDEPDMPRGSSEGSDSVNKPKRFTLEEINLIRRMWGSGDKRPLMPFRPNNKRAIRAAISNFKGGSGKSTCALHFAHAAALDGYKVLLVDFDPQATLSHAMGVYDTPEERTVWGIIARDLARQAEVLAYERKLADRKDEIKVPDTVTALGLDTYTADRFIQPTCWPTIDIIASCANAAFVEFASGEYRMAIPEWSFFGCMDRFLDSLPHDQWDIIIFDNPPAIGYQALNAVFAADVLYIPFGPAYWEYDSTTSFVNQLGDALEELSKGFARSVEVKSKLPKEFLAAKYMLTRFDANNPLHQAMLECVQMAFRDRVAKNHIEATRAVEQSGRHLQSIYEIDYREMTRETWRRARRSFDAAYEEFIETIRGVWHELPDIESRDNETRAA